MAQLTTGQSLGGTRHGNYNQHPQDAALDGGTGSIKSSSHEHACGHTRMHVVIVNEYPVRTMKKTFSSATRNRENDTEEDPAKPMFLPYVRGLSEKLEKSVCTTRREDHL